MNTQLFYIHGYRSHPDQTNPKTEFLQEFCDENDYEFIKPNMEWETRGTEILNQMVDSLRFLDRREPTRKIFVGTSLGGAGALNLLSHFPNEDNCCVAINPLLAYTHSSIAQAEVTMRQHGYEMTRDQFNYYTDEPSELTLDRFVNLHLMTLDNRKFLDDGNYFTYQLQVLLGMHDDIIEPNNSLELIRSYDILHELSPFGTHSFSDPASLDILNRAMDYVRR